MKDYSKMSDFEINKWIAIELAPNGYIGINESTRSDSEVVITTESGEGCTKNSYVDYCNNPSDAWPIMKESLIGVTPDEDGVTMHFYGDWTARAHCKNLQFTDKNPLRAAMIVYLMMKDEDK